MKISTSWCVCCILLEYLFHGHVHVIILFQEENR